MSVGARIRRIRTERGMTQVELAKAVGVTQAMICVIERGTKNPSLQVAVAIAKALDCTMDDFFDEGELYEEG